MDNEKNMNAIRILAFNIIEMALNIPFNFTTSIDE